MERRAVMAMMCRRPPLRLDPGERLAGQERTCATVPADEDGERSTTTTTAAMRAHNGARRDGG
jgi:hypothetical protein